MRTRVLTLALGALLALGCEEDPAAVASTGAPGQAAEAESAAANSQARADYLEPPVNIPTPYRPPRQSTDTVADEDGRPGGGMRQTRRGERFGETFEDFSENDFRQLLDQANQAAQEADADDPCARLFAGFGTFMERDDEGPLMNESRFMRYCERMPADMRACFEAPEEQTEAQKRRCQQLIGTNDIFGDAPWEPPDPPADRRPTPEQARRAKQLARQAAARMNP